MQFERFREHWLGYFLNIISHVDPETEYPNRGAVARSPGIGFVIERNLALPKRRFTYGTIYETLLLLEQALRSKLWLSCSFVVFDILAGGSEEEQVATGKIWSGIGDPTRLRTCQNYSSLMLR